ncbi:hypothetical protein RRG08_001136 [Elysia crispata]|uniref:Alpha/beta hydrolase fold-3 domain-containing protein n=1 Tax=Elysia crispata TaxID=231223 RepID=A0AAE0Y139_9GAST|nr:hypothetical protein RRG08_001136 [Elysia crispata]
MLVNCDSLSTPDVYDPIAREMAKRVSAVLVLVRFRMPPQHIHPAAVDDCVKVTEHVIRQAHNHNFDPNRVAVAGDGAGGQLAAAVTLKVKRLIKIQILICPWLQLFDLQTLSYIENRKYLPGMRSDGDPLTGWMRYGNIPDVHLADLMENRHTSASVKKSRHATYVAPSLYTRHRIRTEALRDPDKPNNFGNEAVSEKLSQTITDPLFAPLMADAKDFRYVPSMAYIVTAGYDVARDDGLIYWQRLKNAQIKAKLAHYEDGFNNMLVFAPVGSASSSLHLTFSIGKRVLDDLIIYLLDEL